MGENPLLVVRALRRKPEVRKSQRSEIRGQGKPEIRGQGKPEIRGRRSEVRENRKARGQGKTELQKSEYQEKQKA